MSDRSGALKAEWQVTTSNAAARLVNWHTWTLSTV